MVTSIASSLGIGAGFDTAKLIEDLAAAARAPKDKMLKARETANSSQISTIGNLTGAIDSFAKSLGSLISGGTLFTQPTSSDATILGVSAQAGQSLGTLSASMEVVRLAAAQSLSSAHVADVAAPVGQGVLTLTTATGNFNITIDSTNDSLTGLASAINGAKAGVTASIVKDSLGSRLMLRGASGEVNAFTLTAQAGADPALSQYTYDGVSAGGMTRAQAAQDAIIKLDGVEIRRASNSFSDVLPGVKFDLKKAVPGTIVTIGAERQTANIRQAVLDYVAAYNELEKMLDNATASGLDGGAAGPLRGNSVMRDMRAQLAGISSAILRSGDGPKMMTEIGVKTQRDGSLTVDTVKLDAALAADPDAVEQLFNPPEGGAATGLGGALKAVRDKLRADTGALAGVEARLKVEAERISDDREAMELRATAYRERLVTTFSAMDSRVAAFKATQTYLDQQIKMWTRSDD